MMEKIRENAHGAADMCGCLVQGRIAAMRPGVGDLRTSAGPATDACSCMLCRQRAVLWAQLPRVSLGSMR